MNSHTRKIFAELKNNDKKDECEKNYQYSEEEIACMPICIQGDFQLTDFESIENTSHDLSQNDIFNIVVIENENLSENNENKTMLDDFDIQELDHSTEKIFQPLMNIDSNSELVPQINISNPNGLLKLVDYDSSSSDSDDEINNNNQKSKPLGKENTNKILIGKGVRYNSENSFHSDPDFSPSETYSDQGLEHSDESLSIVGEKGMRKKRKPNKKNIKKMEYNFGKDRCVKENPCKRKCQHKCSTKISETTRHDIHDFYWGLGNYEKQRNWLLSCIKRVDISRRKTESEYSRRHNSYKYYINWNDIVFEVCQQFLLKTLDISQTVIRYAAKNAFQNICKSDQRGKHIPSNKTSSEMINMVHKFIKDLPAVYSHYCRAKHNNKKYLPQELRNISFLYRVFLKHEEARGIQKNNCVSLKVFRNIFKKDFNLGFHLPKKDKCSMCEKRKDKDFQESNNSKDVYEKHVKEKEDSKKLFLEDQKKVLNKLDTVCSSFDLQKVLNTPHGNNMLLYYSRKYAFYNESVYEAPSRNGYCFLWGESNGNRGCNEICTVIYTYLKILDDREIKNVILYCDSCAGQNKNRAMLFMLQTFVQESKSIKNIKIVFLLPGHTYMPVDSVHATIERFIKHRTVWAPSQWNTIIENARVNPHPYTVITMEHNDFKNWKKFGEELISLKGGLKMSNIKQAYFQKGSPSIRIKYTYDNNDETDLSLELNNQKIGRRRHNNIILLPEIIYKQMLPISELKKKNLEKLCQTNVIPVRFHNEYLQLKSKSSIRDELAQTDEEDEPEENNEED